MTRELGAAEGTYRIKGRKASFREGGRKPRGNSETVREQEEGTSRTSPEV